MPKYWVRLTRVALCLCLCSAPPGSPALAASTPSVAVGGDKHAGGDFTLTDHNGMPYSLKDDRGKVVLLFFGYTSCPDICPTILLTMKSVLQQLGGQARDVQPLFISVDPKRDTPKLIKKYVTYFDPSIIALTGTQAQLRDITRRYKTFYRYTGDTDSDHYLVEHGSNLYVIDQHGQLTNIIPYGTPTDNITTIIKQLLPDHR